MRLRSILWAGAAAVALSAGSAEAQDLPRPHLNFYGVTGLIDMPSAKMQPDGQLAATVSHFGPITRSTFTFQILPRVQGSFRYTGTEDLFGSGTYYDRSFDVSLLILKESRYVPALKAGLQDFGGTGVLSGEYVAATKTMGPLQVTGGLGWGRLGSYQDVGSPFGSRPPLDFGRGGEPNTDQWFRGPAAPFAGLQWQASERLTLLAEYSSDAYEDEEASGALDRDSPFNFGASYQINDYVSLGGYYMYGSEVGVKLTVTAHPYDPPVPGSIEEAPLPVAPRPDRAANPELWTTAWTQAPEVERTLAVATDKALAEYDLQLESLDVSANAATVRVRPGPYEAGAQVVGRTARVLTHTMPASVELFRIVPVVDGLAASTITLRRSDVEALENAPDGAARLLAAAGVSDAAPASEGAELAPDLFPRFSWGLGPYLRSSYFDPNEPVRLAGGLRLSGTYEPRPGLVFSGSLAKPLASNLDESPEGNSVLPRVRTNWPLYEEDDGVKLEKLTGSYYFDAGPDLYGRVTAGYLERMFGGVSGELLWKPATSRLGLGVELNYAVQRDFDDPFDFRDYDVVTGHVSAYYEIGDEFVAQVDVGRYLAGDVGTTIALDRKFDNGWTVGAFATFTDVSAEEFGEGSFDKGIRVAIPLSWFTGEPMRQTAATTLRPTTRDGGARLSVPGRLYGRVTQFHERELEDQWGRVWR